MLIPLSLSSVLVWSSVATPAPPAWQPGVPAQLHLDPSRTAADPTEPARNEETESAQEDPSVAEHGTDPRTAAEEAFTAGEAAFVEGDYVTAVAEFERAQALLPHPFTEYNLALALARGGRELDAWRMFNQLHAHATSAEQQEDVERQLAALSPRVARLRVDAPSGQVLTIDGTPIDAGEELLFLPGAVELRTDGYSKTLELRGGELRHLDLRASDAASDRMPRQSRRALTGVLASASLFAAGTTGVVLAASFQSNDARRPWLMASAGLGGATLVATVTALALHLRARRGARMTRSAR